MPIIYDKTPSKFEFKTFTYSELKAKLIEILDTNILSKRGENGLEHGKDIFAGKGTLGIQVYKIIGFGPCEVWQKLNTNGYRSDFPHTVDEEDLTVIAREVTCDSDRCYVALPSSIFSNFAKLNRGFRKLSHPHQKND